MAKFKYRLQNILNLKYKLEDRQKLILASVRLKLREEEEELEHLYQRKKEYEKAIREASKDKLDIDILKILRENYAIIDYYIMEQKKVVTRAESVVEYEEEKMISAMKERKIQEKLREKSLEKFKLEESHDENIVIDELVSYKYTTKIEEQEGGRDG